MNLLKIECLGVENQIDLANQDTTFITSVIGFKDDGVVETFFLTPISIVSVELGVITALELEIIKEYESANNRAYLNMWNTRYNHTRLVVYRVSPYSSFPECYFTEIR